MLCVHGSRHGWDKLEHLASVAELVRRSPSLDWAAVWHRADAMHCRRMVAFGLLLAHALFDAPLRPEAAAAWHSSPLRAMARQIVRDSGAADAPALTVARQTARYLRLKDTYTDRARAVARELTTLDTGRLGARRPARAAVGRISARARPAGRAQARLHASPGSRRRPMIIDSMFRSFIVRALIAGLGVAVPAMTAAQTAQAPQAPKATRPAPARAPAKRYALSVKNEDGFINVALKARQARIADIAADLGLRLRARVVVGPELAKDAVTVDVPSSPLEAVLQALAPRVLVDYEVRQDAQPRPLGIYLLAPADTEPTANVAARGVSQGVVITGHTEETPTADGSDPVTISGDAHQLSIAAKQQPLALVAMAVADIARRHPGHELSRR